MNGWLVACVAALLGSTVAEAQQAQPWPPTYTHNPPQQYPPVQRQPVPALRPAFEPYLTVGYTHITVNGDIEDANFGGVTLRAGSKFFEYVGLEAEVTLPTVGDELQGIDLKLKRTWGVFARAQFPLGQSAELFARMAYINSGVDAELGALETVVDSTLDADGFAIGAGIGVDVAVRSALRAEYARYQISQNDSDLFDEDQNADTVSISFQQGF
ncbi:MAG: porin family protein [Caulobacterales bacterium]|nr:porin family protein [Caulobacterales bacterium]